jgi:glucokinase
VWGFHAKSVHLIVNKCPAGPLPALLYPPEKGVIYLLLLDLKAIMSSNSAKKYAVGVDIGGTNLRVALVSEKGEVIRKVKEPTSGDIRARLKAILPDFIDSAVAGVGIGAAGVIDRAEQNILMAHNLNILDGLSLRELGLGVPVYLENDANAAALGEQWAGAGQQYKSFALFTLGTGVGGGFVKDGSLLDVPFEVGHMSVEAEGEKCNCGNFGCMELYCSARALTSAAAAELEKDRESTLRDCCHGNIYNISAEEISRAAFDGDALSRELLKRAGRYLGVGVANIIHLLKPEAVVLTGGLTGAWDILAEEARREASRRVLKSLMEQVDIIRSPLGAEDAGILGAAALVLHGRD